MNPIAVTGMVNQRWGTLKESLGRGVLPRPNHADPIKDKNCSLILFPLLNQETLCYEPDSFLFHTQNQQFFENDIMELFSSTYPLRLNKKVPPRIGI